PMPDRPCRPRSARPDRAGPHPGQRQQRAAGGVQVTTRVKFGRLGRVVSKSPRESSPSSDAASDAAGTGALPAVVLRHIEFGPGCWNWKGPLYKSPKKGRAGYGHSTFVGASSGMAHRAIYELLRGPI